MFIEDTTSGNPVIYELVSIDSTDNKVVMKQIGVPGTLTFSYEDYKYNLNHGYYNIYIVQHDDEKNYIPDVNFGFQYQGEHWVVFGRDEFLNYIRVGTSTKEESKVIHLHQFYHMIEQGEVKFITSLKEMPLPKSLVMYVSKNKNLLLLQMDMIVVGYNLEKTYIKLAVRASEFNSDLYDELNPEFIDMTTIHEVYHVLFRMDYKFFAELVVTEQIHLISNDGVRLPKYSQRFVFDGNHAALYQVLGTVGEHLSLRYQSGVRKQMPKSEFYNEYRRGHIILL